MFQEGGLLAEPHAVHRSKLPPGHDELLFPDFNSGFGVRLT